MEKLPLRHRESGPEIFDHNNNQYVRRIRHMREEVHAFQVASGSATWSNIPRPRSTSRFLNLCLRMDNGPYMQISSCGCRATA